ncbi:MAG: bifunctional heptose 7-phosphate kinase/heptose 1-phosphate adenyltransferase [Enhydrobacter sp.]|nr:bifunctional heptose 7-phosphate kinase/heptose 1-phosphate adenyltransferase [Enhydrobacter sp.]
MSTSFRHHLAARWSANGEQILVVGDAMLDVYILGAVNRISPEAPVPVVRQTEIREMGGGGANVAANIVSLGGAAHLIACAGRDAEGQRLAAALSAAGVRFDLIDLDDRPTTVKTRFFSGQHQLLRVDKEELIGLSSAAEEAVIRAIELRVGGARLVIVSDYGKGLLTDRVLEHTMALAHAAAIPIVVDPKRVDLSAYRGATVITPNRKELEAATGIAVTSDLEAEQAGRAAAAITGGSILVTRSEAGMSLVSPQGSAIHMPTQARAVFDVAGAGDTVAAAFALGLASGRPVEEAMAFANLAAGIAVSKPGTTVVQADDLEAERALLAGDGLVDKGALAEWDTALRLRRLWQHQGLVVGFTNGCFDLLHPGHVSLLRETAKACDRLIVGLNSDASVRRLKGSGRPVQGERERAAVLGAIDNVSIVVIFEQDTPAQLIELLLPDLLVKGADYTINEIVGAETVTRAGGRVMTVDLVPGHSTTRLIANSARSD